MTSQDRTAHLVGALPYRSAEQSMRVALEQVGPYLRSLPDGEPPPRDMWVKVELDGFRSVPGLEIINSGAGWTDYQDVTSFRVPAGRILTAAEVETCLPTRDVFPASYRTFRELRLAFGLPGLAFQQGLPSPVDLAFLAFGEAGLGPDLYGAVVQAKAAHISACMSAADDHDAVFQLEAPIPTCFVAGAPREAQAKTAAQMAGLLSQLAAFLPAGTRIGVHLCWGDLHHRSITFPASAEPLVLLANEIAGQWPAECPLQWVHFPFAAAAEPPPLQDDWYRPLSETTLGQRGVRVVAGFVHEALDVSELRVLQEVIERNLGAPAGVSTTCGLGRRPDPGQAADALGKLSLLAAGSALTP